MIPGQLGRLVLGRRRFWMWVAIILALKIGVVVAVMMAPQSFSFLSHSDTWLMLALAFVVGARFADVGWPRWIGITLVVLITFVVPIALILIQPSKANLQAENPVDRMPDLAWVSTLALVLLLVVAGSRPSSAEPPGGASGAAPPTPGT